MAEEEKKAKKLAAKKPAADQKTGAGGKTIRVTQTGSPIGREDWQQATLIGLGLNRRGRTRVLEDTPAVRGMIARVHHLVRIEDAA